MNNKFLKTFIIMISSFAASVGLAACNDGSSIGNNLVMNQLLVTILLVIVLYQLQKLIVITIIKK